MWDFSWLLRHHRFGSFEDWDAVLDGLVERGYNAIRIDAMPQFVAADTDGSVQEEFFCVKDGWTPASWGNDLSVYVRPREALLEFLPKCYERGIHVGLASWFLPHGGPRKDLFEEEGGLLRAWVETLEFLDRRDLLEPVLYVDVLNEYPFWHGYAWLKNELDRRNDVKTLREDDPDAHIPELDPEESQQGMNSVQQDFYSRFLTSTLSQLRSRWPEIPFHASLDSGMRLADIDLSSFDALDYHVWFVHNSDMDATGYDQIHGMKNESKFYGVNREIVRYWREHRAELIAWIDARMAAVSAAARQYGIPCGNTEGWGPINWMDHPALGWDWVKESGDICSELALRHGYRFICTSNFTHPQFRGMWQDAAWHQKITSRIKNG